MAISTITKTTTGATHSQGADPGRICRDPTGRKRSDTAAGTMIETGAGAMIEAEAGMTGMIMTGDRHSIPWPQYPKLAKPGPNK